VPEDLQIVKRELNTALTNGDLYRAEFRIKRADNGKINWMRGYGRVVSKEEGVPTRMVGVMFDITETKLIEQQKDEFIGIASHELKTPVTSIKAFSEILQEKFENAGDSESAELMKKLNRQVDRLTDLISDLLDTTKIAEGRLQLNFEPTDLNELIRSTVEEMQRTTHKHKIAVELGKVPVIDADKERLSQVMINLLNNAVKYSPQGGDITVISETNRDHVRVTVSDRGIGISPESQSKIFERFYRISTPPLHTYPGMGLGLYISAGIVQRHGGRIKVESREGKGSSFSFTLPIEKIKNE
jgi:signal transduction histidine kinase